MKKKKIVKSIDQSVDELELLLSTMAKGIVDHPAEIVIHRAVNQTGFVGFEVLCAESDAGALVGKRGSHADAIRLLMMASAAARGIRVTVNLMSSHGGLGRR